MDGLHWITDSGQSPHAPCSRCQATGCPWDQLAGKAICPDCQELLAQGEGEPLIERAQKRPCAVCGQIGTISFVTFPLHAPTALGIDLCPRHIHALLARRLDRGSYFQLARQMQNLGLASRQVFLLHEAFYDEQGRSLQPLPDAF
jgi:hypothetical protein